MKVWLLLFALGLASAAGAQEIEHAPTAAQCQADAAVWHAKLGAPAASWLETAKDVNVKTLLAWMHEMATCEEVDPNNREYNKVVEDALLVICARRGDFIERHHLLAQFMEEDDALVRKEGGK